MNKKGFTLVELLATLLVLAIIMGIVLVSTTGGFGKAKERTEAIFVDTLRDAMDVYLNTDAKRLNFGSTPVCTISKTHSSSVSVYKSSNSLTFNNVINSSYHPISSSDMHNPANKNTDKYECKSTGVLEIYRDDDYIYYYRINKNSFDCLTYYEDVYITNLPSGCNP